LRVRVGVALPERYANFLSERPTLSGPWGLADLLYKLFPQHFQRISIYKWLRSWCSVRSSKPHLEPSSAPSLGSASPCAKGSSNSTGLDATSPTIPISSAVSVDCSRTHAILQSRGPLGQEWPEPGRTALGLPEVKACAGERRESDRCLATMASARRGQPQFDTCRSSRLPAADQQPGRSGTKRTKAPISGDISSARVGSLPAGIVRLSSHCPACV
jgi:hypothetical protein